MTKDADDWIRNIWVTIILVTLCFGAWKFLSSTQETASMFSFIPSAVAAGLFFIYQVMQHIVGLLPHYDLSTWLSISLMLGSILIFYFGFKESHADSKAGLMSFAGALFGLGSGIPIGKATSRQAATRTRSTSNTTKKTTPTP